MRFQIKIMPLAEMLLLMLLLTQTGYADWQVDIVDYGPAAGRFCSLILDADDCPHVTYYDALFTHEDLIYARWDGQQWISQCVDSEGDTGENTSLRIDSIGNPHIAYRACHPLYDLKYAYWTGSEWQLMTVDDADFAGNYAALELDSQDCPHISYFAGGTYDRSLKYATWDGENWQIQRIADTDLNGSRSAMALDSQDHAHISFVGNEDLNGRFKYAHWDGQAWIIEEIMDHDYISAWSTSIITDSMDRPHISFLYNSFYLGYAFRDEEGWHVENVDYEGSNGFYTSIEVDRFDDPHISYHRHDVLELKYAHRKNGRWIIDVVEDGSYTGIDSSLELDSSDMPHICYYDQTFGILKYAFYKYEPDLQPTPTPAPQPTPTNTPHIELGVRVHMPKYVSPGDDFFVIGEIVNNGDMLQDMTVLFVFRWYDSYWFWPTWTYFNTHHDVDYQVFDIPSGSTFIDVIPSFPWIDTGNDRMTQLWFYGIMMSPDRSRIVGEWDVKQWGFGP